MAAACVHLLENAQSVRATVGDGRPPLVNIGCGHDVTIAQLAERVRDAVGSRAEIVFDRSKPDGTPRKLLDISLIRALGWQPRIELAEGLKATYAAFVQSAL
jgi:GDP-L-fucose synthase